MYKKIFGAIFLTCISILFFTHIILFFLLDSMLESQAFQTLKKEAHLLKNHLHLLIEEKIPLSHRISILSKNGDILYESLQMDLPNHKDREEFITALKQHESKSIRYSETLQKKMLYYAISSTLNGENVVLRLAMPQKSIEDIFYYFLPYFIFEILFCIFIIFFIARILTKSIIKPLQSIHLESLLQKVPYKELTPFVERLKNEHKIVKNRLKGLKQRQGQMLLLVHNMSDGLILLDKQGKILLANKRAEEYFSHITNMLHINEIEDNLFLQKVWTYLNVFKKDKEQKNEHFRLGYKESEVLFCPVYSKNKFRGIVIILQNLDAEIQAKNMRREFSANVTHELKTPLTSILASSEMLKHHLVSQEDFPTFINNIHEEAKKLLKMINEIIQISFLDEQEGFLPTQKINIGAITSAVLKRLELIAKQHLINIQCNIQNAYILGNAELIENMIYNLCDNAIKYNHHKGNVWVNVTQENGKIKFCVKDSGIGIPKDSTHRIFERFYRVDKGRCKHFGGTGLGLSIVKSVVHYHQAQLTFHTQEGKGSEFVILFNAI
ncbi:hypothetical protein CCZ01_09265 [Helicobacter monodelphidis]|uniref:ATP-binding protein n=1 Tax=Helicobacter sp. 15-1451 TaxID=2004995 RepID=UPI000DCB20C8|nr:ATP-binding protein [Helicobacter sp. 15-1451]RAX56526.1 hypothetical protein CCZ01_09265 [Helicobacter sp. 15-1451]